MSSRVESFEITQDPQHQRIVLTFNTEELDAELLGNLQSKKIVTKNSRIQNHNYFIDLNFDDGTSSTIMFEDANHKDHLKSIQYPTLIVALMDEGEIVFGFKLEHHAH